MDPKKLGDSYDFVKREIMRGLAPPEHWAAHPMYFAQEQNRDSNFLARYKAFLGVHRVAGDIFDREQVVTLGRQCQEHLLLDPDTGLPGPKSRRPRGGRRVCIDIGELAKIATAPKRRQMLTLVFDQCYSRANCHQVNKEIAENKLKALRHHGVYGAAYVSHAVFIWVSGCKLSVVGGSRRLMRDLRIPQKCLVGDGV
jgi:hypothetical protein